MLPVETSELELIIDTSEPAIPLTVVERLLPDVVFEIELTSGTDPSETPLTLPEIVLPVEVKAPELIIFAF